MTTHKTFTGMAKAVERLIANLEKYGIKDEFEYRQADRQMSGLMKELNALWSNPADVTEAARLGNRLSDAWHKATN